MIIYDSYNKWSKDRFVSSSPNSRSAIALPPSTPVGQEEFEEAKGTCTTPHSSFRFFLLLVSSLAWQMYIDFASKFRKVLETSWKEDVRRGDFVCVCTG
jgi:hypothetical protein